jgi:hypothetical protein
LRKSGSDVQISLSKHWPLSHALLLPMITINCDYQHRWYNKAIPKGNYKICILITHPSTILLINSWNSETSKRFSPAKITLQMSKHHAIMYLVILFKFITFFLTTIASYWGYIQHSGSEFYESTPAESINFYSSTFKDSYNIIYRMIYLLIGISRSAM